LVGRQQPWWRFPPKHWASKPKAVSASDLWGLALIQCAAGDFAMGCPSQTIVHAIEFIQIRALQHRFSGRLIRRVGNYLKPKVFWRCASTPYGRRLKNNFRGG
jgi:hypothetical protein